VGRVRLLCCVIAAALVLPAGASFSAAPDNANAARVTHISDGDTGYFKPLKYGTTAASWEGRKARFIGVDTPETYTSPPDCYGEKASNFTQRQLEGKRVKVTYGKDTLDQYGRALIYIWRKGKLFNAKLIRRGFARVEMYSPNDKYDGWFRRLESEAKAANRGMWGAC
jgi:micrococcal nuclease